RAWIFKLKPNIVFSNGEPFNADAVTTAIAWLKTPEGRRSVIGNEVRDIAGAEKVDDLTVIVRTERPDAILPRRISSVLLVAPKAWTTLGPEKFSKTPATTGSFMMKDWGEGTGRVVMDAFKQSWRAPIVDRLVVVNLADNAARMQALQSRQIDIAGNINVDDMEMVEAFGGRVVSGSSASVNAIAFKVISERNTPLKDVRVRQALNYAVDKESLNKVLLRGLAAPSGQPAAMGVTGHDPAIKPYPYDPAKAKALLAEAGYGKGFAMKIEVIVDRTPGDAAVYQTLADMLNQVGVKAELRTIPFPSWLTKYLSGTFDKDTDAFTLSWNAAPSANDVARPMEIYSCLNPHPFFCDEGLAKQLTAAGEEMNLAKREEMLKKLGRAYHDAAPSLFLLDLNDFFGVRGGVDDVEIINRVPAYHKVKITKPR
ncbi:MAG: hypothetical protein JNK21_13195, partial [Rhodospirillaceae bacterium]|nr:hypothetical protein [Rhodospirillaceae bacterium]